MIPASSVATCARRSIGTVAVHGWLGTCLRCARRSVHCDQACIQAVIPRRRNNASPSPSPPCSELLVASRRSCSYCSVRSGLASSEPPDSFNGVFFDDAAGCVRYFVDEPWSRNALGSSAPVPMSRSDGCFWRVSTMKARTSSVSLCACLGPRLCGTNPASPPSSKADSA